MMKRALTGIQASGKQHLGNYLGVMQSLIELQEQCQLFVFVADLHSITVDFQPQALKQNNFDLVRTLLAVGLDPQKACLFLQSDLLEHSMMGYLMMVQSNLGELQRMTQFKAKKAEQTRNPNGTLNIPTGLLTYPALMAGDILLYQPDIVPVGNDQKQHLELTRDLAQRIQKKFKLKLRLPQFVQNKDTNRIMDLFDPTKKMSKSSKNQNGVIYLDDPKEVVVKKIRQATTDSFNKIRFASKTQPGVTNMLTILKALLKEPVNQSLTNQLGNDLEAYFSTKSYLDLKNALTEATVNLLVNIQRKREQISREQAFNCLQAGKNQAQATARTTLALFYDGFGLGSQNIK
ncbi:tryptophan--tRNA ligase [Mycoplasmoides pneumoniae]